MGVWEQQLAEMISRQGRTAQRILKRVEGKHNAAARMLADAGAERDKLAARLEQFAAEMEEHLGTRDDPEVRIRDYNETTIETYHVAKGPPYCGWVNPQRSRLILLSQAKRRGYHPCKSCGAAIELGH